MKAQGWVLACALGHSWRWEDSMPHSRRSGNVCEITTYTTRVHHPGAHTACPHTVYNRYSSHTQTHQAHRHTQGHKKAPLKHTGMAMQGGT